MSFEGGYQSDTVLTAGSFRGGAVFITDIEPQQIADNVGAKVFSSDGLVLQSCSSSTDLIRVSILAITGFSTFKPTIEVEGEEVSLSQDEDQNVWKGTIDIDLNGKQSIQATHNDGAFHNCMILTEATPVITAALFQGEYPNGQTELKENDVFALSVEASLPFVSIEVDDFGAAKAESFAVPETTQANITITVADRGNVTTDYGAKIRVENSNGTKSEWFETTSQGTLNKVHQVKLNNIRPSIVINSINYPDGQEALKNVETATVNHEISDFDTVLYSSSNGELDVTEAQNYSTAKVVQRQSGEYNIVNDNLTITANRTANGSETTESLIVQIAHALPTINLTKPQGRLISGGNNGTEIQSHLLELSSNQKLLNAPVISIPEGQLEGAMEDQGATKLFQQIVKIHDNDQKGTFEVQLIEATNLAGLTINSLEGNRNYEIGGFVERILSFQEFANEATIGTSVSDVSKLIAFDKDEIPMTYVNTLEDGLLTYSITEPTQTLNPTGNIFHWNDQQAVNNNSTGLATVTIKEEA